MKGMEFSVQLGKSLDIKTLGETLAVKTTETNIDPFFSNARNSSSSAFSREESLRRALRRAILHHDTTYRVSAFGLVEEFRYVSHALGFLVALCVSSWREVDEIP